jgi:hypothetical protein
MGLKIFEDQRDELDIVAVTHDESVISSLGRQYHLFVAGFRFEAAIARAALVEGLLLMYLMIAKQLRSWTQRSKFCRTRNTVPYRK